MFERALEVKSNPPISPKKFKKGASQTEKELYWRKRRKYNLQKKYYKKHRREIRRKNIRPKYKVFMKKLEKLRIEHINKSFASTEFNNPQYEKLSQIYHRYLKVTMKQIQPGQKMLVVPKDVKKEDIDFLYEKLKVELKQQGYKRIPLLPEKDRIKGKKYTINDFFLKNFLNKTPLVIEGKESQTFADISKEDFNIFKDESPFYPLDAVMRIIIHDGNPDGFIGKVVDEYRGKKKINASHLLTTKSDVFLSPKSLKKIERTIQDHYKKYREWKLWVVDQAGIGDNGDDFDEKFNKPDFESFNEAFLDKIIPNPYMQVAEKLILYNETGRSSKGFGSRETLTKFADTYLSWFFDESTVGEFQVGDWRVRKKMDKFLARAKMVEKLIEKHKPGLYADNEVDKNFGIKFKKIVRELEAISKSLKIKGVDPSDYTEDIEQILRKSPYLSRIANILMMEDDWIPVKKHSRTMGVDYQKYPVYIIRTLSNSHQSGTTGVRMSEDYNRWILSSEKLGMLDENGKYQKKIIENHQLSVRKRNVDSYIGKLPYLLQYELRNTAQWFRKRAKDVVGRTKSFNSTKFIYEGIHRHLLSKKEYKGELTRKLFLSTSKRVIQNILSFWDNPKTKIQKNLILDLTNREFDKNILNRIKSEMSNYFGVKALETELEKIEAEKSIVIELIKNEGKMRFILNI